MDTLLFEHFKINQTVIQSIDPMCFTYHLSLILFLCTGLALNAQIRVAERPMTKQGLTGMRTAAGRGQARNSFQHVSVFILSLID